MADDNQKNADFIARVVGDAKNPPETRMLTGWFGDSGEDGYRRLYTDAELSSYIDIPDDAILYSEPVRDAQPAGCVMVWIKRDAALKPGGSAASRAARFLQGQVQQDFASAGAAGSLDKAGLRCVTEVPCGEPTGFTGQCTKQPDVGGAWPCITAIPHCYEVTGFTGKCTHAPWPNPTRYIGCTILHCPTHDLTHIPHICNIVASGQPGCVVVNPPQGGDPAQKVGAAEVDEKAVPVTSVPGCGYTKTWGVCETHLLGCGKAQDDAAYITSICQPTAFCHISNNPNCQTGDAQAVGAPAGGGGFQLASAICATNIACNVTLICPSHFVLCQRTPICPTRFQPQCFPIPSPFCPVTPGCPFGPGGGGTPVQQAGNVAAFGAAAQNPVNPARVRPVNPVGTLFVQCNPSAIDACPSQRGCTQIGGCQTQPVPECPSAIDGCPTRINCDTQLPTAFCTQFPEACQTNCGPLCQTQQLNCTQVACTQAGPACPTPQLDCTFTVTLGGPACPTINQPNCPITDPITIQAAGAQAFGAQAQVWTHGGEVCAQAVGAPAPQTQFPGCPASDLVACSLFGGCPTLPKGDCTFFGCPSLPQQFGTPAPGGGGGCTQSGPQCPTHAQPLCTIVGPACPPTPGIACTHVTTCKTHQLPCPSPQFECTMFCTHGAPGCPQTINSPACVGPITLGGPQCPVHTGFNCPSAIGCQSVACQSIACQSLACQPGGGIDQRAFGAAQPVTSTPNCGITPQPNCGFAFAAAQPQAAPAIQPTLIGVQCQSHLLGCTYFGPQCRTYPRGDCTFFGCTQLGPQCPPHPSLQGQFCPVTLGGPECPVHTGFNCPSQVCQSIACQSIACQPGGGGQQMQFAQQAVGGPQTAATVCTQLNCPNTLATLCTQLGAQCPPHPTGGIDCTVVTCTHIGPQCPNTAATVCTQSGPQCPPHTAGCPSPGIDCTAILCTHIGPQCPITRGPTICTQLGPQCPQTPACPTPLCTHLGPQCPITRGPTICTQLGPQCPHTAGCPSPGVDCTVILCTKIGPQCPNTAATLCTQSGPQCPPHQTLPICPITVGGPQCPPASGFNCPSAFGCQSIACGQSVACVSAGCQPGGGGQRAFGAALDQSTEFCPTSGGCGGVAHGQAVGGVTPWYPTPATRCFICPPFGNQY